jgi:hypothetical protein
LSSVAVDDGEELMVGLVDVSETPCVTVYCFFVLERKEESIALQLEVVSLTGLLDGTSLDYHFDIGFGAAGTLQHLSLRLWRRQFDWGSLLGGDEVFTLFIIVFLAFRLLGKFVPRFVVIEHWGDVTLELVGRF